jgi:hypothetical protein
MAIASCLVDTNILLRITRRSDLQHKIVDTALARLGTGHNALLHTPEHRRTLECDDPACCP